MSVYNKLRNQYKNTETNELYSMLRHYKRMVKCQTNEWCQDAVKAIKDELKHRGCTHEPLHRFT